MRTMDEIMKEQISKNIPKRKKVNIDALMELNPIEREVILQLMEGKSYIKSEIRKMLETKNIITSCDR